MSLSAFFDQIVREVAELPDRTSPADDTQQMLVSAGELKAILERCFADGPDRSKDDNTTGEEKYAAYRKSVALEVVEDDDIEQTLKMLETWGPGAWPANDAGQVHFARAMIDSAAAAIRKHLETSKGAQS